MALNTEEIDGISSGSILRNDTDGVISGDMTIFGDVSVAGDVNPGSVALAISFVALRHLS